MRAAARRLGIREMRAEQERVITESLAGHDVLMVLPTGFGKSACYQIPSMVLDKPVLMISPLISLLRDQHQKMIARDIPCVRLDGSVRGRNRKAAFDQVEAGGPLLVMTTPETLTTEDVQKLLQKTGVGLAAIDEAHCISEWGHDFRPAYLRLGMSLRALGEPPLLALTATATPRVREAIVKTLGMRNPRVVASSPHRSNLAFEVIHCTGDERLRALARLAQRLRRPGIIYCSTRREVDTAWAVLKRFGIPGHRYHGGMTATERNAEQERYMKNGRRSVMVATNAFGLGIDKPDIRYVMHYQAPAALEQYVQEAGRGGRDGRKSNCILLNDPADRSIHEALLARSRIRPDQLYRVGHALAAWGDEGRTPTLDALALSAELGPRITAALLAKIEEADLVHWEDSEIRITGSPESIETEVRALAGQFETLRTQDSRRLDTISDYANSDVCRAVFLCEYFGEESEGACGLCDVCRGRPQRASSFFEPLIAPKVDRGRKVRGGRGRSGGKSRGGQRGRAGGSEARPKPAAKTRRRRRRRPKPTS
jgi:ATP-dependent DNA helicase RecQ